MSVRVRLYQLVPAPGDGNYLQSYDPEAHGGRGGKTEWRRIGVEAGRNVQVCNDIADAVLPIDIDYYAMEVEKLCLGLT